MIHWLQTLGDGRLAAYGLSFIVGVSFAMGWMSCVGVTLGEILSLTAGPQGGASAALLGIYMAGGLMAPSLVLGWSVGWAVRGVAGRESRSRWATPMVGLLLMGIGITVFTGNVREPTGYLFTLDARPAPHLEGC